MKVYFISGLGADKTVFQLLKLHNAEPVFIDWITPLKNESLPDYALRLKSFYKIPDNAFIAGLSFGGMLTTEIAKAFPSVKGILLSSAKTSKEIPFYYRTGKYFSLYKWTSPKMQRWFMLRIKSWFDLKTPAFIKVYEELIANSDTAFNNWAVSALLNWSNKIVPGNVVHVHGTIDKILPYKYVTSNYTIRKGGHLMVLEQAAEVSAIMNDIIEGYLSASSSASQPGHLCQA
ncbi:alpha/beta hydrolase [Panacibacter sp. DH6]|uniref:Alpha/beta hydrolase n=1 Tax=Panacibacter microcysteis TaxID=2793269 RepID=A0A931EAY9_9BACT|nr:alpha/beta hydrolase [Panacibacter microcysteis]MBG9377086.1 alpha/beta hydrolase [Panacibacter microcysteis]